MTWGDLGGRLHNRVVFVTLNKGSGTVQDPAADWASFHSGTHDYLLAEAIGQPGIQEVFGGAYITDFFKGLPPSTTGSLNLLLDSLSAIAQARTVQAMEALLERELHILGCERPLLIGVGRDAERWLRKRMNSFRVVGISHYEDVECPDAYARELKRAAMFVSSRTVRA
ncbi:MAG: hypothetical protein GX678_07850 [Actinomycetales bacterium]|nr:hypothetical protein [Actinomycetales bacterium]